MPYKLQYPALVEPLEPSLTTAVSDLRWYQPASEPIHRRRRLHPQGQLVQPWEPSLFTAVSDLRWYEPASEPVHRLRRRLPEGCEVAPLEPSLVVAVADLRYWQPASEPVHRRRRLLPEGTGFVQPLEPSLFTPVNDLRWEAEYPDQVHRLRRRLPEGISVRPDTAVLTPDETITADKWYQPASEPIHRRRHRLPEGRDAEVLEPSLTTAVNDLRWAPDTEPVPHRRKRFIAGGEFAPDTGVNTSESITLDKWYQPATEPVHRNKHRVPGLWTGVLEASLVTPVADLRWYQPASEPVHRRKPPHAGWVGAYQAEPTVLVEPTPSGAFDDDLEAEIVFRDPGRDVSFYDPDARGNRF